jgi:phenylpropionate dioxygenase-like ring-hydroxylating dioxygenase large terminal subunit
MYLARSRLPHLLAPRDYFAPSRYARELTDALEPAWHLAGTADDLPRHGDFLTFELLGRQVLLRNVEDEYSAVANVCAHRHCLLTGERRGRAEKLRCQYHGWEYGDDGCATHIPQARWFAPLDARSRPRLDRFRTATCGRLIFVSVVDDGPTLADQLGDAYELCAVKFGDAWSQSYGTDAVFPVNWKVPVENALEAYHVPSVHPTTFREDPGEARSTHRIERKRTEMTTGLPFSAHSRIDDLMQRLEGSFLRMLGSPVTGTYRHVHCFPNLLLSFTDSLGLAQCIIPTGPSGSRNVVRLFGTGAALKPAWKRGAARLWSKIVAWVTRRILQEDFRFYEQVQRGLEASEQAGMLGRCEERIHAFQHWLLEQCDGVAPPEEFAGQSSASPERPVDESRSAAVNAEDPAIVVAALNDVNNGCDT